MTALHDFLAARAVELERVARSQCGRRDPWEIVTAAGRQVRLIRALLEVHVPTQGQVFTPCRCGKAFCDCPTMGPACEECRGPQECPTLILVAGSLFPRHGDLRAEWAA